MGKEVFGEYSAFDSSKGIRFQKSNKLVSESSVPPEVVSYLKSKLTIPELDYPKPTPEELAKMKAESLKVAPGLELTPEEEAARATAPPLEVSDFVEPDGSFNPVPNDEQPELTDDQIAAIGASTTPSVDTEFMERSSIYTADIKDIAQVLYDRFGVYTIYLNATPQTDEINPLTGEAFSRYHQGIAYQALIRARGSGFFNRNPEIGAELMTKGRVAHENYVKEVGDPRQPEATQPDATQATPDSFAYRTSPSANATTQTHYIAHEPDPTTGEIRAVRREVPQEAQHQGKVNNSRQRFDNNQDEMIVEPQFGQQVIRPNW